MSPKNIPSFVLKILQRLSRAGHQAFIVGGAVRDACLKRPVTDWDVATSARAHAIRALFQDINTFSLKHETVTLVNAGVSYHVTPFRKGATSLEDDLARRDFTVNAMAYDPFPDRLIDPFGGHRDLRCKKIKAVGDPGARIQEDPLRLLRSVRLAVELGFSIEEPTLTHVTAMAFLLGRVAAERIRDELVKILLVEKPSRGFHLLVRTGLLKGFLPELLEGYRIRQNAFHRYTVFRHVMETLDRVEPTPLMRLTALLHDIAKPRVRSRRDGEWRFYRHEQASADLAGQILDRLRFSKAMIQKVTNLIRHHMIGYNTQWSDGAVRRFIRRVGPENVLDLLRFRHADLDAHGLPRERPGPLDELEQRVGACMAEPLVLGPRDLAITGRQVMETLDISPGYEVGRILNQLVERVSEDPSLNQEKRLLELIKAIRPERSGKDRRHR